MIGDNLMTDILFGNNAQIDTLLVLTGISKREEIVPSKVKPTYVMEELRY